ncbi:11124_t:CDS:2 [Gigaspora margarita]|uniref:11124_t:CDS:1 n=1 Tax=Gigaspora margarita TaxID=4874 RepID=A0ABN7UFL8_GIGMA|nr:11124_t:CDS:2 [Gigaspora margarita]
MAQELTAKSTFMFDIPAFIIHSQDCIYSPAFSTSYNCFWQLQLKKCKEYPKYYSLTLNAIPNPDESISSSTWDDRARFSATLFMHNPSLTLEHGPLGDASSKDYEFGIEKFVHSKNFPETGDVTIGVWIDDTKLENEKPEYHCLPTKPWPKDIIDAWYEELNQPDISDVQFNLSETTIFARSSILTKRSEYFRKIIEGSWIEGSQRGPQRSSQQNNYDNQRSVKNNTTKEPGNESPPSELSNDEVRLNGEKDTSPQEGKKYQINVPDIHQETFMELLRFLYTNYVEFDSNSLHRRPIDIFIVADKYLVIELRQIAKSKIFNELTVDNAAEFLFGVVWQWSDLKSDVMKYVASEFQKVRKTDGFKRIFRNSTDYPAGMEIMSELLKLLVPGEDDD